MCSILRLGGPFRPEVERGAPIASNQCAWASIDPIALAWAAGFFDGEGSTFVWQRRDRCGYVRLGIAVPQSDHNGVPEVLVRFQAAMLGMGTIGTPNEDGTYLWRPNGFMETQSTSARRWVRQARWFR